MERTQKMIDDGEITKHTKKEQLMTAREVEVLGTFFSGIWRFEKTAGSDFCPGHGDDHIPVEEARQTKVKVTGLVDTNADPTKVDYLILSVDDATKVIEFMA